MSTSGFLVKLFHLTTVWFGVQSEGNREVKGILISISKPCWWHDFSIGFKAFVTFVTIDWFEKKGSSFIFLGPKRSQNVKWRLIIMDTEVKDRCMAKL